MKAGEKQSKGVASGVVALVFLVLGFQLAVFVIKVVERPSRQAEPGMTATTNNTTDTTDATVASEAAGGVRRSDLFSGARRTPEQRSERNVKTERRSERGYETFPFDPNTVSLADLQRLGLTLRQAETIDHYRSKGGRFRTKDDFRKMYVVTDSLFARLEPFIKIPKVELNAADSAALVSLRGIGPYYARKILDYRERLGGFLNKAQLLEIEGLDEERLAGFADDVEIDTTCCSRLDLWHTTDSILARHPYLGEKGARSITRYKKLYDTTRWTLADLEKEHALPKENIEKLKKYIEIQ
jgi:DNA uptake protein ComE-like DNA-binding protein